MKVIERQNGLRGVIERSKDEELGATEKTRAFWYMFRING